MFKVGNIVYYEDVANGVSSGQYKIVSIRGNVYLIDNKFTELECFRHEIRKV